MTKTDDRAGEPPMSNKGAPITVRILKDSITDGGSRLVTWEWMYPRMIHAEIMTHRALSKCSASSRAIPARKLRERVVGSPVIPIEWGANQAGMQAGGEIADVDAAEAWWLRGRDLMAEHHAEGERLGLHKQIVNRVIEPWMTITVIVSATDHANLFHLRKHKDAEPHFQKLATLAWEQFHEHMPTYVKRGDWHLPYDDEGSREPSILTLEQRIQVSAGRCARVSYLTHEGKRDPQEDIALHDRLVKPASRGIDPIHASPLEHPAQAVGERERHGNFEGWKQYRKLFAHENGPNTNERCERCGCWAGRHVKACPSNVISCGTECTGCRYCV